MQALVARFGGAFARDRNGREASGKLIRATRAQGGSLRRAATGTRLLAVLACLAALLPSCDSATDQPGVATALGDDAITIGSFDFGESELLAELYAAALEAEGFEIERMLRIGPRELVQPALAEGLLEFVPEYSGTALRFLSLDQTEAVSDANDTYDALTHVLADGPLVAMKPSSAQDANAFVVRRNTAQRYELDSISDLEGVAPQLTLGGPPECPTRPLCLPGLEQTYGLRFDHFLPLDAGGPITHEALRERYIDVAVLFTTDPALTSRDLVVLADDRGLQPAENVTPLVRREVLERWGRGFRDIVDTVSAQMTTRLLRALNAQLAEGGDAFTVAQEWVARHRSTP